MQRRDIIKTGLITALAGVAAVNFLVGCKGKEGTEEENEEGEGQKVSPQKI